jgi:GT2 family glycosyltransferase
MIVSIETPVFKGRRLRRLIDSVLHQSSPQWHFSLLWDGGDQESRSVLEELDREKHPNVTVYFAENRGIARARRFLSEHSHGDFILPVDDDDVLPFYAVERFLAVAEQRPWAAVIRAQRKMIDDEGKVLDAAPWFPFEPRHYQSGMVTDLLNHTHPYLISRWAYQRTSGWEGFADFKFAGEDCDIYIKLEEVGTVELVDETLYYYRIHPERASLVLTEHTAYEMWRRLADKTIARIGLPLKRVNERPPFVYDRLPRPAPTLEMVDVVIVAADQRARSQGERLAASLRKAGMADDAVRVVEGNEVAAISAGIRQGTRPFVCVLDAGVLLDGTDGIGTLLRLMHEHEADLTVPKLIDEKGATIWANPGFRNGNGSGGHLPAVGDPGQGDSVTDAAWVDGRLVLARREVINAVGGLDEGYRDIGMAFVDFTLRARQRQFKCVYLGTVSLACAAGHRPADDAEWGRLRRKWGSYPQLFLS